MGVSVLAVYPLPFARQPGFELVALNLAAGGPRKFRKIDEPELPGTFVSGKIAPAQSKQVRLGDRGVAARHECHGNFTPFHIGDTHNRGLGDPCITHQNALDLGWINVFDAILDNVLGAIDEIERAVIIAPKHVAHVKPPAAKIAHVGIISFPIAGE